MSGRMKLVVFGFIAALAVGGIVTALSIDRQPPFTYLSGEFPDGFAPPGASPNLDLWIDFHRANCWMELTRSWEDSEGKLFKEDTVVKLGPPPTTGKRFSSRPVKIPERVIDKNGKLRGPAYGRARYLPYAHLYCPGRNWIESLINRKPIYIGPPKFDIPIVIIKEPETK